MLQILTYMLAFYLVVKGMEILQIALASNREKRDGIINYWSPHTNCVHRRSRWVRYDARSTSNVRGPYHERAISIARK
jgi:hypothetical protein